MRCAHPSIFLLYTRSSKGEPYSLISSMMGLWFWKSESQSNNKIDYIRIGGYHFCKAFPFLEFSLVNLYISQKRGATPIFQGKTNNLISWQNSTRTTRDVFCKTQVILYKTTGIDIESAARFLIHEASLFKILLACQKNLSCSPLHIKPCIEFMLEWLHDTSMEVFYLLRCVHETILASTLLTSSPPIHDYSWTRIPKRNLRGCYLMKKQSISGSLVWR